MGNFESKTHEKWLDFYENQQRLASEDYISKAYNTYVDAYNRHRISIADMIALSERQMETLNEIESDLVDRYGFEMDAWYYIAASSRELYTEVFQEWINRNNYTKEMFHEAFGVICEKSKEYFEIETECYLKKVVMYAITKKGYPDELKYFDELTKVEQETIKNANSNSDKLYVANDWLNDLVRDIANIESPTHNKILIRIKDDFPEFKNLSDGTVPDFIKGPGNINKTSIDKVLTYLFNKKHDATISEKAINKRFTKYGIW
jgi:hypothetical protein